MRALSMSIVHIVLMRGRKSDTLLTRPLTATGPDVVAANRRLGGENVRLTYYFAGGPFT